MSLCHVLCLNYLQPFPLYSTRDYSVSCLVTLKSEDELASLYLSIITANLMIIKLSLFTLTAQLPPQLSSDFRWHHSSAPTARLTSDLWPSAGGRGTSVSSDVAETMLTGRRVGCWHGDDPCTHPAAGELCRGAVVKRGEGRQAVK